MLRLCIAAGATTLLCTVQLATSAPALGVCSPVQSSYSGLVASTPGLVGYWRLGERSGTLACDYTGHDNGAYQGGVTLGLPGAIGQDPDTAIGLDGSTGQVSVPASSTLNVGDAFSIEAWVKRGNSKTGSNQTIASKQDGSWVLMFNESDRLTLRRSTVGNLASATVATTDTTTWHYVAATKNGSSVHLYVDGTDVTGTLTNQTMANNNLPLAIGQSTGTAYLKGTIDEAALYNTALTPTQITQHYTTGTGPPAPPSGLSAVGANGQVKLAWKASPSTGLTGYDVYRANPDGSWAATPLATVSSATLAYSDGGLTNGTAYTYRVTAVGTGGLQSSPSNQASATPNSVCSPVQSSYSGLVASTPGLVGYWRLGERSGTLACDYTGHDNGAYQGGVTLGLPGAIGQDPDTAIGLDGSTGQVSVPASSTLNVGDAFSIEAWVKRGNSKTGSNQTIASKQDGSWVLMFNESDRLTLRRSTVGNLASATVATTDTTTWHYVAATKNGSSVHLYVDGTDVTGTLTNQTMANNNLPLAIGQSTGTAYLKGTIDEAALYNTALTPTQITQHYTTGTGPPNKDPVLAAAGDIACAPGDKTHECVQAATASLTAAQHPNAAAVLGDNQYESGLLSEYDSPGAYNDTWGQFNSVVHPSPGNHEYAASTSASGYFTYFGASAAGGYYSYDLGSWHVVALNSNCSDSGCRDSLAGTVSNAELSWLQSDLAAHPGQCTLAYWHHPLFSSGWVGNSPGVAPIWKILYAAHADIVLNGHDHMYERFAQQDPNQLATTAGIREFVAGTGGETLFTMGTTQPNMQFVDNHHFGALFLTLHSGSYEWAFRSTDGFVRDSGSTGCHSPNLAGPTMAASPVRSPAAPAPALQRAAPPTPFHVAAQPLHVGLVYATQRGLPLQVRCSRACDVRIALRATGRHGRAFTRHYVETESQISSPVSQIALRLPGALHRRRWVHVTLRLSAVDAGGQRRALSRSFTLVR
jgi:acid phosphatase type 7